jgi:hypothetical protein
MKYYDMSTFAYMAGVRAFHQFFTLSDNPYKDDTIEYDDWEAGWMDEEYKEKLDMAEYFKKSA